jgi:hypothetical protein
MPGTPWGYRIPHLNPNGWLQDVGSVSQERSQSHQPDCSGLSRPPTRSNGRSRDEVEDDLRPSKARRLLDWTRAT